VAARLRQVLEQVEPVGDCRLTMSYGVVQWLEGEDQHAAGACRQGALRAKGRQERNCCLRGAHAALSRRSWAATRTLIASP
jgi:ubiquinone biosynthesis protein UbiJ